MMSLVSVELLVVRRSNYFRLGHMIIEVEVLVYNCWLFLHLRRLYNACERFLVVCLSSNVTIIVMRCGYVELIRRVI